MFKKLVFNQEDLRLNYVLFLDSMCCFWTLCAALGLYVLLLDFMCCFWTLCAVFGLYVLFLDSLCFSLKSQARFNQSKKAKLLKFILSLSAF